MGVIQFELKDIFDKYKYLTICVLAFLLSGVSILNPQLSIVLIISAIIFVNIIRNPLFGFALFMIIIPFTGHEAVDIQIMGIPGFKPINVIGIILIASYYIRSKTNKLEKKDKLFIVFIIGVLFISITRSICFLDTMNDFWNEDMNILRYYQSHFVKPVVYFIPLIISCLYIRKQKDIDKLIWGLLISLFALSIYLIIYYALYVPSKDDFEKVRFAFGEVLKMHGNDLIDFFIVLMPLLYVYANHKRNLFVIITLAVSFTAIGILYSRTGYLTIIVGFLLYFLTKKRIKFVPIIIIVVILVGSVLPVTVRDRIMTGFNEDESEVVNDVSAGRTEYLWIPLVNEYINKPVKMLFGDGRYSIIHTDVFNDDSIIRAGNPHNMYLECILDTGVIGFLIFLVFGFFIIKKINYIEKNYKNEYQKDLLLGIKIAIVCYLISGITGRSFFPVNPNAYLWVVIGILISVYYNIKHEIIENESDKG